VNTSAPSRSTGPARHALRSSARRHGTGFWLIALSLLAAMAFSTVPSPPYPLYRQRDHFSTFTVTVVFAVYAVGVVVSLLLAGHVSDWVGRKRIIIPAITLEAIAAVMFLLWPDLPVLTLARLVNGIAVGMITATATAHLHELHPKHRPGAGPTRFEMVSTAANIGGLGAGPLAAGPLAQYVTQPLRVPYIVIIVLLLLAVIAVGQAPETVEARPDRPTWRPQRIRAHGDRIRYLIATAGAFSAFAVFGLFTALAPGFVGGTLHHPSRLLAGVSVFIIFIAAAVSQAATARMRPGLRSVIGLGTQASGLVIVAAGMGAANPCPVPLRRRGRRRRRRRLIRRHPGGRGNVAAGRDGVSQDRFESMVDDADGVVRRAHRQERAPRDRRVHLVACQSGEEIGHGERDDRHAWTSKRARMTWVPRLRLHTGR
jgi:MFS family permease